MAWLCGFICVASYTYEATTMDVLNMAVAPQPCTFNAEDVFTFYLNKILNMNVKELDTVGNIVTK